MKTLAALLLVLAAGEAAADTDPIVGKWAYNPARSSYGDARQALARAYAWYEIDASGRLRFTSEIHRPDGQLVRRSWSAAFDGRDYAVAGDPGFDAVALRRINPHVILFIYKKDDRVLSAQVREVSPDRKTMTLTQLGVSADGRVLNNIVFFERQ